MKFLTPMIEFVFDCTKTNDEDFIDGLQKLVKIYHYATFLKQRLEIWMFVPCDAEGNIMTKPKISCATCNECTCSMDYVKAWEQAKERCLFKDFRIENYTLTNDIIGLGQALTLYSDIESLSDDFRGRDIELTPTALKQLGL